MSHGVSYESKRFSVNWTNMGVDAVGHEFRLPIWRNEGDCSVTVEARETDTLVELHVLHHHCLSLVT